MTTETPPSAQLLPLKTCPFCGGFAKKYGGGLSQETETVICTNCFSESSPIVWNDRAPDPLLAEAMGALKEIIEQNGQYLKQHSLMQARSIFSKYNGGAKC